MKNQDVVEQLMNEFNSRYISKKVRYGPLGLKLPGFGVWTMYDGSRYKEPGRVVSENKKALGEFWQFIKSQKGAKFLGYMSGEFGSCPRGEAVSYKGTLMSKNPWSVTWGSMSRLKNDCVWNISENNSNPFSEDL